MINRIFNWTAVSFFRTLGRFIFYGLITAIVVFLFSILNTKALENQQLGTIVADSGGFLSLSSFPSWSSMGYSTYSDGSWASASPTSNFVYGTNGGALTQCGIPVVQDMYYSVTYTFQWTSTFDYLHPYYTSWTGHEIGICDNSNCSPYLPYETLSSGVEYTNYNGTILGFFTVIFKASANGTCVNIAFSSNSRTLNSQNVNFVGYRYESLGSKSLSESDIQEALEVNFNNIQNSINQFQQEQQETNDKLDKTNEELGEMNDYIQDDTPANTEDVDLDSLGTVSGLLPAGPLDSLLNIPFTFLSVLTSSMSGTCVPITGTFVFDSTLSIPCFDSFYDEVPDYLMNFINLIPAGFILIMYFKHLYKKIERAVSLETSVDDEWGVI